MDANKKPEIITSLEKLPDLLQALQNNPGVFIMKLGAEWCGPCKRIEGLVKTCMDQAPANVQCAVIDVDEAIEVYGFLKTKRVVNGIPAILGYYQGNLNYIPDDVVIGSDQKQVIAFFQRCYEKAKQ
jgi:thiol-disulfide isomerase/thioredoxin